MLQERRVKSSTPKKLSVSSERMEQSFKKVQHYAVTECSLSFPIKEPKRAASQTQSLSEKGAFFGVSVENDSKVNRCYPGSSLFILTVKNILRIITNNN